MSETRSGAEKVTVRYEDIARCFAGARSVGVAQHVGVTADGPIILFEHGIGVCAVINALANAHAPEPGRCHDDDVALTTAGTERLQLTVLAHLTCINGFTSTLPSYLPIRNSAIMCPRRVVLRVVNVVEVRINREVDGKPAANVIVRTYERTHRRTDKSKT